MATLGDLLSSSGEAGKQLFLWGILMGIINQATQPWQRDIGYIVNDLDPNIELSPADAATAVNRGFATKAQGEAKAKRSGVGPDVFSIMTDLAGDAPSPQDLANALRRNIINEDSAKDGIPSFNDGIRQGNLRDIWTPMIKALTVQIPSVAEVMNAWLEGQIEEPEAHRRYLEAGGDPTWFQTSYNANGSAPTPSEAATMANRGIIPWDGAGPQEVTFQQAFLEGPWRNKWEEVYRKLAEYLPPPRTVTAMQRAGSLTATEAFDLYKKQGLSDTLANAYVADASNQKIAGSKDLALSQVMEIYNDKIIDHATALDMVEGLGYDAQSANWLLAFEDMKRAVAYQNKAISKIHTLFIGHHLDAPAVRQALGALSVPGTGQDQLLKSWTLEREANVKTLTEAQVAEAYKYGAITVAEAFTRLQQLGMTPRDAWIRLYIETHSAPSIPEPPPGPAPATTTGG